MISSDFRTKAAKWDELTPVVEAEQSPLEIMLNIANAIPANSGVRLTIADIGPDGVKLTGAAPQSAPSNAFSLALKRTADLSWLDWENEAPRKTAKGSEFRFTGTAPRK